MIPRNWQLSEGWSRLTPADHVNRALARLSLADEVWRRVADMVDDLRAGSDFTALAELDAVLQAKRGCKR